MAMSSESLSSPSPRNPKTKRRKPTMPLLPNKNKLEEGLTKLSPSKLLKPMLLNFSLFSPAKPLKRRLLRKSQLFIQLRVLE